MDNSSYVIVVVAVTPKFVFILLVLLVVFALILYYYIGASRQLRRLQTIGRAIYMSPFAIHFNRS